MNVVSVTFFLSFLFCTQVCPGREGPIFFGDEHYGYTLSYTFFVKDSQARGFQRWYSIIVVMMDKMFLLNSWPFLTSNIRSIIDKIQAQAISIYEKEQAAKSERAERINRQLHAPQTFYLRRGGGTQAFRSLIDLTGDKQLFRYLHMLFAWILMAGGSRFTEKFLEGPPNEEEFLDFAREEGKGNLVLCLLCVFIYFVCVYVCFSLSAMNQSCDVNGGLSQLARGISFLNTALVT